MYASLVETRQLESAAPPSDQVGIADSDSPWTGPSCLAFVHAQAYWFLVGHRGIYPYITPM